MRVILDTNIYLNFYRRKSDESIKSLKLLSDLVVQSKIILVLPKQISDEFIRNKNAASVIYNDHIKVLEKELTLGEAVVPSFLKLSLPAKKINNLKQRIAKARKELIEEYQKRVDNPQSLINKGIRKLFNYAQKSEEAENVLTRAHFRTLKGNPPRKDNNSFGDAIIWESILEYYTDDDLTIISGDGDFASERNEKQLNELLEKEWKEKTNKTIKLVDTLGEFLNEYLPKKGKKQVVSREEIEGEKIFGGVTDVFPYLISNSLNLGDVKQCVCCGVQFSLKKENRFGSMDINSYILNSEDKCRECRSYGKISYCDNCGRHFHEKSDVYSGLIFKNLCEDCKNNNLNTGLDFKSFLNP